MSGRDWLPSSEGDMTPKQRAPSPSKTGVSEAGNPVLVRVVRCPSCGLLLPEYAGLALYRCGGCSIPLVAKAQFSNNDILAQSEPEGLRKSCNSEQTSTKDGQNQVPEYAIRESSCTDRSLVSGGSATSIIEEVKIAAETVRVENMQSERSLSCDSPGTPPNKEDNSRCVEPEDSENLIMKNSRISVDRSIHEEEMVAVQTKPLEMSDANMPQAVVDPGAFREELPPSTDRGHIKEKHRNHPTEDKALVSDSPGIPTYGNQSNERRVIHRKDELRKNGISNSPNQYKDVCNLNKPLPNAEVSDDGFLGSDQRIKLGMNQRKEKTLEFETADGLTYIKQSVEYYGHSKEIRSRKQKAPNVSSRKDRPSYRNECPSNFLPSSTAEPSHRAEPNRPDKEELLRRLDELRDQLSRSRKVKDAPKSRERMNKREDSTMPLKSPDRNGWFHERTSKEWSAVQKSPVMNGHILNRNGYHSSLHAHEKRLEDPLRSHVHRRPPHERSHHNKLLTSNTPVNEIFLSGSVLPHPHSSGSGLHQSSCLCVQCFNNYHLMPLRSTLTAPKNQVSPNFPNGHGLSSVRDAVVLGTGYNKSRRSRYPSQPSKPANFRRSGPVRMCRSLAGAAPFIVCSHCLHLLQLPCDILRSKKKLKVQCGYCLCLLVVKINGIHLTVTMTPTISDANRKIDGQCHLQHGASKSHPGEFSGARDKIAFANEKLLLSSTPFSANTESMEQQNTSDVKEPNKIEKLSFPPSASPDQDLENTSYQRDTPRPLHDKDQFPQESEKNMIVSDSPLNSVFGYRGPDPAVDENDTRSLSEHLDSTHEDSVENSPGMIRAHPLTDEFPNSSLPMPGNTSEDVLYQSHLSENSEFPRKSPKNAYGYESANDKFRHVASSQVGYRTETGSTLVAQKYSSVDRHANQNFPQNSEYKSIEDSPKFSNGGRYSLTGLVKKSFKNISRTNESVNSRKYKFVINGHPIPEHLIRKAEQYAGPIVPGSYWYDCRAGFWGVQGQPCLGIIPPDIEEFKYPMTKNCSGGNTSILINGRELHQSEFNLLVQRGLRTARNRSYIVDISGRVFDADSGEELESLGKLAPTVAQLRRGFGMCPLNLI